MHLLLVLWFGLLRVSVELDIREQKVMKGRSHRISDHSNDWLEESWTVDCVCGVTFDDGEEMVNCDECGVWVHTRCSRYVRGEASFHCDKCEAKNCPNDSEETEVAQLLAELPTQTMRIDNSCHPINPPQGPYRSRIDRPTEDKVHVQGIPGGDPELFDDFKSIFTRELWNCTGYVRKRFKFQYKEFPCCEEKMEADDRDEEDHENPVSRGAGVLYSLSKKAMLGNPTTSPVCMRNINGEGSSKRTPSLKEMEKHKARDVENITHVKSSGTEVKNILRPSVIHSGRRKREFNGKFRDGSEKRKSSTMEEECIGKKLASQAAIKVSPFSDAKHMEFYKGSGPKIFESDSKNSRSWNMMDTLVQESINVEYNKNISAPSKHSKIFSSDVSNHDISIGVGLKAAVSAITSNSFKIVDPVPLSSTENDVGKSLGSVEGDKSDDDKGEHCSSSDLINLQKPGPLSEKHSKNGHSIKDKRSFPTTIVNMSMSAAKLSPQGNGSVNTEKIKASDFPSAHNDMKLGDINQTIHHPSTFCGYMFENVVKSPLVSCSQCIDDKVKDVDRGCNGVNDCHIDNSGDPFRLKCEVGCSSENNSAPLSHGLKLENSPHHDSIYNLQAENDNSIRNDSSEEMPKNSVLNALRSSKISSHSKASNRSEFVGSVQTQCTLTPKNKISASGLSQRGEKFNHSSSLPFFKTNHASSTHPPVPSKPPVKLSDEELALLLHQELNSSPRVLHRVPRVRHPGSAPQLTSPGSTNTLIKHSYGSGGKDNCLVSSKRRNKNASKHLPHNSHKIDDNDAIKIDDKLPSSDQLKPDLASTNHKAMCDDSLNTVNSLSSSLEANQYNSSRNFSDDDTGTTGVLSHQTLPGLISVILSSGKHMTYDELCNAVLPHWNHLRKQNGERYAYSSHSQAVLDCLRNRSEWSQLVDRGPKMNGYGKKRRKVEGEGDNVELDTAMEGVGKEFPKGKRKARKRRRVGAEVFVSQDQTNNDMNSNSNTNSNSSGEDTVFSEESSGSDR